MKYKRAILLVMMVSFAFSETSGFTRITSVFFSPAEDKEVVEPLSKLAQKPDLTRYGNDGLNNPSFTGNVQVVKVQDLMFKAKKIETVEYLLSKGLSPSEIDLELENGLDENLFYFDIEEVNRQDVLKKYHTTDMNQAVSYLAFSISKDFLVLTDKGDTIKPNYTMYERNFHAAPFERVILNFSGLDRTQTFKLIYNDVLFNKGQMEFGFQNEFNQFLISENV